MLLSGLLSGLLLHPVPSLLVPCVTLLHTSFTHPLVYLLAGSFTLSLWTWLCVHPGHPGEGGVAELS